MGAGSGPGISRLWVATIDVSSKREATFISLRDAEMAVKRKGFIVSLWMENKNFLQKLLKADCIYWRLEPVFEDKRVLRKDFGNVLKYLDREYWNGCLN